MSLFCKRKEQKRISIRWYPSTRPDTALSQSDSKFTHSQTVAKRRISDTGGEILVRKSGQSFRSKLFDISTREKRTGRSCHGQIHKTHIYAPKLIRPFGLRGCMNASIVVRMLIWPLKSPSEEQADARVKPFCHSVRETRDLN
jgi:hypothetical protein